MDNKKFVLEKSKSGAYTLYQEEKEVKKYIHSKYDPVKEAETVLKSIDLNKYDFIVLAGNGLGYLLNKILAIKKTKKVIVIEKEEGIYEEFLKINKKEDYNNVDFLIDKDPEYVSNYISNKFNLLNYKGFYLIELPGVTACSQSYFKGLKLLLNKRLDEKVNNQLTESSLGVSLVNNFLNNLHQLDNINIFKINKAVSREKKAIIVSAGPSLEKDIKKLKILQKGCYIFAVDTALKYLLKNNITPDLVFSMDPQFYTYYHFYPYDANENIRTVLDIFTGFPAMKLVNDPLIMISSNFISGHLFDREFLTLPGGGSITNFIFQYIKDYFEEIIFLGLDLCYKDLNMYIGHTYLNQYFLKRNTRIKSLQSIYLKFYLSRAKRKIKFNNNEYATTMSMINYFQTLVEAVKGSNVYFSNNSIIDFKNINKIDLNEVKSPEKKEDIFLIKKIPTSDLSGRLKDLVKNNDFMSSLTEAVILSKYIDRWQDFTDKEKESHYNKYNDYLKKKIEGIV